MSKIAVTKVPGRSDIELPAFYESFEWYYPNCELQTKEWFVRNAQADWVYFDCGANIGYYSILFSQLSPSGFVHAVEPTVTAEMLARNLNYNHVSNVEIHRVALGDFAGKRKDKLYRIWGEPPEEDEYQFVTVDQLVSARNIERVDCLKIDVDSFDFEVLRGAEKTILRFDPWIIIELSNNLGLRDYSVAEVLSWFQDRGYRTARILDKENYIFKRIKTTDHPNEIPIDFIHWLIERDILSDLVGKLRDIPFDIPWAIDGYAVDCLVSSARSAKLAAKIQEWSIPSQMYPEWQSYQYAAFANTFSPDCVLQFGRWSGEFTFSLMTGLKCAADRNTDRLWSFCKSTLWNSGPVYEKLVKNLGLDWLGMANFLTRLPINSELEAIVSTAKRVLVFWNDPSRECGDIIFGTLLPLIRDRQHAVIIHGISDGRFGTAPGYDGDGASMLALGDMWSSRTDLPRIVDFTVRNKLQLLSPERAFKSEIKMPRNLVKELEDLIGPLFATSAGWHWLTLNGHTAPIFFPKQ
jgi:FkbM family methyltransferase